MKTLLRHKITVMLLIAALAVKLFSLQPAWVERYYTFGLYPYIAKVLRLLFGFLPFSFGDLLYAAAAIYLFWLAYKGMRFLKSYGPKKTAPKVFIRLLQLALVVYLCFAIFWGLNYNRLGIGHQLGLQVKRYTVTDLVLLTSTLQTKLNMYAAQLDTAERKWLDNNRHLFKNAIATYSLAQTRWPFLHYAYPSTKGSMYSKFGHYFGFTGYYNPFTAEAQINNDVPSFIKPFVATHEIAHQLGYAAENEANFVAYLSSKSSTDLHFLYSVYYELYRYALRELYSRNILVAGTFKRKLHPRVLQDNKTLRAYFFSKQNKVEPLVSVFYDRYLKANNQKKGVRTYNEVVALLVAYGRKFGAAAI